MQSSSLPSHEEMVQAMLTGDRAFEGVFFTAVKTTGIFCRPTCRARKPLPQNVVFYATAEDALAAGFRPCLRCCPLDPSGAAPAWVTEVLHLVETAPNRRWTDKDLLARGVDPLRLRRWFAEHHRTTFHHFARSRRLGLALGALSEGSSLDDAAEEAGYGSLSGFRGAVSRTLKTTPGQARAQSVLLYTRLLTPLGPMIAMAEANGLVLLEFLDRPALTAEIEELRSRYDYLIAPGENEHLRAVDDELKTYFAGQLRWFTVPVVMPGTEFQRRVWQELRHIAYGTTISYGQMAQALGAPGASRAVGQANGQNRLAVVIPCHRVIGADGALTGYGGGQPRKEFLVRLEREAVTGADAHQQELF